MNIYSKKEHDISKYESILLADIENLRMCSIDPPIPTGIFRDYLSGKGVITHV